MLRYHERPADDPGQWSVSTFSYRFNHFRKIHDADQKLRIKLAGFA